jgi:excisionase family DNA binding protein
MTKRNRLDVAGPIERQTLTVEEAAGILGIGRNSAYEAARRGELPVIRLGRRLVIPRQAFERFLGGSGSGEAQSSEGRPHILIKQSK